MNRHVRLACLAATLALLPRCAGPAAGAGSPAPRGSAPRGMLHGSATAIRLNRTAHFPANEVKGLVELPADDYEVLPDGPSGLRVQSRERSGVFRIAAAPLSHDEPLAANAAAVFQAADSETIVLQRPGGTGLIARGSVSGQRPRNLAMTGSAVALGTILADAQSPGTWGDPPVWKTMRVFAPEFCWTGPVEYFGIDMGMRATTNRTTLEGYECTEGYITLDLPQGAVLTQIRIAGNDNDLYRDMRLLLRKYRFGTADYQPRIEDFTLNLGVVSSSGRSDWCWRWGTYYKLDENEFFEIHVQLPHSIPPNLRNSTNGDFCRFRFVDICYAPPK